SKRMTCCASAFSARSRSVVNSSRRDPMNMPQPTLTPMITTVHDQVVADPWVSVGLLNVRTTLATTETTATGMTSRRLRRVDSETRAHVAGPAAEDDTTVANAESNATGTGNRRRH